jgi:hypothetical protein
MPKIDIDPEFIVSIVLGDLNAPDYPDLSVTVLRETHPFKDEMVLGLSVSLGPVQNHAIREVLHLKRVPPEDLERTVWQTYYNVARKMAFKLFEIDPRIGLPLSENFPNCPLFDPPYLAAPYRNYLKERGGDAVWKRKPETIEVKKTLTTCPRCDEPIHPYEGSRKPGVWCGGNLGFAHEECVPWVAPRH